MCLGKVDNFGHNQSFHPIPLQTPALCGSVKGDVIILSKSATPQFIRILITTMESCTAGQIASLLTDTSGSSAIIEGAFVTYSNDAKITCGVCGRSFSRRDRGTSTLWLCRNYIKKGPTGCSSKGIRERLLKEIVSSTLGESGLEDVDRVDNITVYPDGRLIITVDDEEIEKAWRLCRTLFFVKTRKWKIGRNNPI